MTSAEFVSDLKPILEARAGLAGVGVHLTAIGDVKAPAIILIRARVAHDVSWIAMGPKRQDEVTVPGLVVTTGKDLQDAADQMEDILSEIAAAVTPATPAVGAQTRKAELSSVAWLPFPSDKGGWTVDCEFDLTYTSDLA